MVWLYQLKSIWMMNFMFQFQFQMLWLHLSILSTTMVFIQSLIFSYYEEIAIDYSQTDEDNSGMNFTTDFSSISNFQFPLTYKFTLTQIVLLLVQSKRN